MNLLMSEHQSLNFSEGSERRRDLVFKSHPKTLFDSSYLPSAWNFFMDMISFRGIMSDGSRGLAFEWIARGSTLLILRLFSPKSGDIPMKSLMYISM